MVEPRYQTAFTLYPYARVASQDRVARHRVVVVGAGPIGLAMALDLGQKGTPVLVLDDHEGPGLGSRAICFSKRSLDIATRLGAQASMVDKGVVWNVGKVFYGDGKLFEFNLLPEEGHRNPAFVNLQQPHFEAYLIEAIHKAQAGGAPIEIRGANRVSGLRDHNDYVTLDVNTQDGPYQLEADWLIACDGARSPVRDMMGLSFDGRVFEDNFLIADVKMKADFPTERWFWFEPPFAKGCQSALLHKQPDDIWRIDFQLGWDIDREQELDPDRIGARVDAMLSSQTGTIPDYTLEWTSIYTFQCRRMKKFRHGSVLFAGDSAHQVSPFGARGANSGMQDADNLAWKLDLVCKGLADARLLDSYATEREFAADENILNSSRATDFMTPKTGISQVFRNAVLDLAREYEFARPIVNSGRLSVPCTYDGHDGFCADTLEAPKISRPGSVCPDGPLNDGYLLDQLGGHFTILSFGDPSFTPAPLADLAVQVLHIPYPTEELIWRYLGANSAATYLIRPDQHVVARWAEFNLEKVSAALRNSLEGACK